jgi:hypothetical protein
LAPPVGVPIQRQYDPQGAEAVEHLQMPCVIMQKELGIEKRAYEILQILNLTLFEKASLKELLLSVNVSENKSDSCNQLLLFN